jgi:hypothetical protein
MAAGGVDLYDLVPDLVLSLQSPGGSEYANVSEEEWVGRLKNSFWNGFNDELFASYTIIDDEVVPRSGTTPMPRELQQLIILYVSIETMARQLSTLQTMFRAQAGPVEYEVQQSATLAKALYDSLLADRARVLENLRRTLYATNTYVIDTYQARQSAIRYGDSFWVGD